MYYNCLQKDYFNDLLNFNEIAPAPIANHNVNNLITIAITIDIENSIPYNDNNPAKLPSVIPIPPGINVIVPIITDAEYVVTISRNPTKSNPKAEIMRKRPIPSTSLCNIVNNMEITTSFGDFDS